MTGVQIAALSGGLLMLGFVLALWQLVPAQPDLADALNRLSPAYTRGTTSAEPAVQARTDRVGLWAMRHLPNAVWGRTPSRELALLQIPQPRFYGEKLTLALLGLAFPALMGTSLAMLGIGLPLVLPVGGGVLLAGVLWFLPNLNATSHAKRARADFTRAMSAYLELVALERNAGSGARQAMEAAAQVGDSWVFHRLGEELARSRWSGQAPWDALHALADELDLRVLDDLADIMRLSGEEGAQVYATLRARGAALRAAIRTDDHARANAMSEHMTVPTVALGGVFVALLITPPLLRLVGLV